MWPDKGIAIHYHFEDVKAALREAKKELVSQFTSSDEDRALFEKYWSFDE